MVQGIAEPATTYDIAEPATTNNGPNTRTVQGMFVSDERDVDDVGQASEGTHAAGAKASEAEDSYLLSWDVDRSFWGEMPTRQWSPGWVGWPKEKPRHLRRRPRWHLALTIGLCVSFAVCAILIAVG